MAQLRFSSFEIVNSLGQAFGLPYDEAFRVMKDAGLPASVLVGAMRQLNYPMDEMKRVICELKFDLHEPRSAFEDSDGSFAEDNDDFKATDDDDIDGDNDDAFDDNGE